MTARPPVSCYIRTLNEESRIGATVWAALGVAREVVVVDCGSSDDTVARAVEAGARVIEQPWLGYGHQKRVGEDGCAHDWVLDLDADEVITEALTREIRDLFAGGEPDADVYRIALMFVDPGGRVWRKARPLWRNKLYDRRKVRQPAHEVWDQFRVPDGVRVARLDGRLLNYPFLDIGHYARKQVDNAFRLARALADERHSPTALKVYFGLPYFFFRSWVLRGRWREGAYGFLMSVTVAYAHWLRYALLHRREWREPLRDRGP